MILRYCVSILFLYCHIVYSLPPPIYSAYPSQWVLQYDMSTGVKQLGTQSISLKSVYHHNSIHSKIPGLFRVLDLSNNTTIQSLEEQTSFNIQPIIGTTYQPREEHRKELFRQRKAGKPMRYNEINTYSQYDALSPTEYPLPDIKDHTSVLTFAQMTYNAYLELGKEKDWYDMGGQWKTNSSFGWESDGVRGHVFGNEDNSLLVISYKGTSAGLFNTEPTGDRDKFNDNMLFSCCCGKASTRWTAICECYDESSPKQCDSQCLTRNLLKSELYYDYAASIYIDVVDKYPNATIWLTGHSLGGALASLIGQTFGVPAVSFESPGDRLAARRLHLPQPPGAAQQPIWHFGHTADPIFIGVCTGPTSGCYYGGYAMEARCHTHKVCAWDTVRDNGWRVNINSHRLAIVIEDILKKPETFPLPNCDIQTDCEDCGLWQFYDNRDEPSLSTDNTTGQCGI